MSQIIASMARKSDPWTAAGAAPPANPSKAETVNQGNKEYEPLKLIRTTEDKPRSLADIVAEDRAIEMLAQTYADMACTPARKSHAVGKDAYLRSVAAALERASEIIRGQIGK